MRTGSLRDTPSQCFLWMWNYWPGKATLVLILLCVYGEGVEHTDDLCTSTSFVIGGMGTPACAVSARMQVMGAYVDSHPTLHLLMCKTYSLCVAMAGQADVHSYIVIDYRG
jgi:hypothetical protein